MSQVRAWIVAGAAVMAGAAMLPPAVAAQTWSETKCANYRQDWSEALARRGTGGLSPDFVAGQEAFIASGCLDQGHVCPRSPEELELANILTIRAMNAGTASTFLPFGCRK